MSVNPSSAKIIAEAQRLSVSALVELFEIDATSLGVPAVLRFHNGINQVGASVVFGGVTYSAFPIQVTGFEFKVKTDLPRPTLRMANVTSAITSLVLQYNDLVGAKVTRRRTFAKYLDAVNFTGGSGITADSTQITVDDTSITADATATLTGADSSAEFPPDIFYINRKTSENKLSVEFELSTSLELDGVQLPKRIINSSTCVWGYRSSECGFADNAVIADETNGIPPTPILNWRGPYDSSVVYSYGDGVELTYPRAPRLVFLYTNATASSGKAPPNTLYWFQDRCSKRISGCKLRFDSTNTGKALPIGTFPGTALMPNVN